MPASAVGSWPVIPDAKVKAAISTKPVRVLAACISRYQVLVTGTLSVADRPNRTLRKRIGSRNVNRGELHRGTRSGNYKHSFHCV